MEVQPFYFFTLKISEKNLHDNICKAEKNSGNNCFKYYTQNRERQNLLILNNLAWKPYYHKF